MLIIKISRVQKLFSLYFFLFSLFSCELFTGPKVDLFKQISDEVDWANAPKLTVSVAFPPEWGNSPQSGEDKCGDTRKGHEFGVEFTPLSGYGFEKWLAFKTADYADLDKNASYSEIENSSLNGKEVTITENVSITGARTAKVTIKITEPVTLVPWCNSRPRLTQQTNPPIHPILTPFPYNQKINIWFNMDIKQETAVLDQTIIIYGIYASSIGDSERGEPFKGNGNLKEYFTLEFPAANRITLTPKAETASELALLSISVTAGPGIQNSAGVTMAQAEVISYQTDSREAQKAYHAVNITASRNGTSWFGDSAEYPWNSPSIDRRFNQSDKNIVHVRFFVTPPEGAPSTPNRITVIERRAYDLRGFDASGQLETEYSGLNPIDGVYAFSHTLQTTNSGIIQFVVLPWYQDAATPVLPLLVNEAVAEGLYVTIVLDLASPDVGSLNARLNDPSSVENGTGIYVYGSGAEIILTVDGLENLTDNGTQGGIKTAQAWGFPWTMDDISGLYWYVQIGEDSQAEKKTSGRLDVYDGLTFNKTWSPADITNLLNPGGYRVYVKFEDSMGNISLDWKDTGLKVKYSTAAISPVTGLQAECNSAGNSITVRWNTLTGMTGAYIYVNGAENRIDGIGLKSYGFQVPVINKSNVRNGQAVSNVTRCDIRVEAYSPAGRAAAQTLSVWNIPDMIVNQSNIVVLTQSNLTTALAANTNNFVLTGDIIISDTWTPVGTSASPFTGKFYGNGHTFIINSFAANPGEDAGLFGVIDGGLVRDLTVVYDDNPVTDANNVGGIAGRMTGGARILNCMVKSATGTEALSLNTSVSVDARLGGIAGYAEESFIANCLAALNVKLESDNMGMQNKNDCVGAVAGEGSGVVIDGITVAANVTGTLTDSSPTLNSSLNVGGAVGISAGSTMRDIVVSGGEVSFYIYGNGGGRAFSGGVMGNAANSNMENCSFAGVIGPIHDGQINSIFLGGLIGNYYIETDYISDCHINNCHVWGNIELGSAGVKTVGGVLGFSANDSAKKIIITNSFYEEGNITVTGDSDANVGGFIGNMSGLHNINNCGAKGGNINVETTSGNLIAGGFTSDFIGNISNCFSMANVSTRMDSDANQRWHYIGGFMGRLQNGTISSCYAAGNVRGVQKNCYGSICAGGLVGISKENDVLPGGTIEHCYALGDVLAEGNNETYTNGACAGGLVGRNDGIVRYSFSAGQVIAQSEKNPAYAAGIAGYNATSSIYNTAALGGKITAAFGNTTAAYNQYAGRIVGNAASYMSNNYAINSMLTGISAYQDYIPGTVVTTGTATNVDGANMSIANTVNNTFWKTLLNNGTMWDFSTVVGKGHPILYGLEGQ